MIAIHRLTDSLLDFVVCEWPKCCKAKPLRVARSLQETRISSNSYVYFQGKPDYVNGRVHAHAELYSLMVLQSRHLKWPSIGDGNDNEFC